jgi:putative flippase GtrA
VNRLSRLLQAIAPNLVPAGGWFLAGWQPSTALIVFWGENLIASLAIGLRAFIHQRLTRKRGYEGRFLVGFITTALAFTLAHGVFLAVVVLGLLDATVDRAEVVGGLRWMATAQLASLVVDLFLLRRWPFAEIRTRTEWVLGRVVAVHMTILIGMFLSISLDRPTRVLSVFIVLKTLIDLGALLPQIDVTEPPRWMIRLAKRVPRKKGQDSFEVAWRKQHQAEIDKRRRDETTL